MKTIEEFEVQDSPPSPAGSIGMPDIVRMLFKHKWLLLGFALLGLGAAATMYVNHVAQYESTSKILVRYVEEVSNVDPTEDGRGRGNPIDSVITAEVEILQSWDLAKEVVDALTPEVFIGKSAAPSRDLAAQVFIKNLEVVAPKGGRVISATFRHPDPEVAVKALNTLVHLYQERHVEIHRATKSRETARARKNALTGKITSLTEEIEQLKSENGISSLAEAAAGLNRRGDEIKTQVAAAEIDLQEQVARVAELERMGLLKSADAVAPADSSSAETSAAAPAAQTTTDRSAHLQYQAVLKRLATVQENYDRSKGLYKSGSTELQQVRAEMQELEGKLAELEKQNPGLLGVGPAIIPGAPLPPAIDPMVESVKLATLKARVQFLTKKQEAMKAEFKQFAGVSKRLHELERDRELQSEGLRHFASAFQRNEFESPLTADQYDNIVVVQRSSPPVLALSKLFKVMAGIGFGTIAAGLALVALLELVINRSIKRPLEIETRVGIPLMCNIPRVALPDRRASKKKNSAEIVGVEAWANAHFFRPFAEGIRDRLVLHFEQVGLTRKPKLVGVASYSRGAGVSTVASGIAAALSETGDGKVLLVDMNTAHAQVHPFFEGKPAATLTEALEQGGKMESASGNLYLATASTAAGRSAQLFPKRFYDMMPDFQASAFDYIIFDMPPMDESSLTLAMSGFLDKLLLVVEAEKDNRDAVKRASGELLRAKAKLSGVLNKTRSYGPKWLQEA